MTGGVRGVGQLGFVAGSAGSALPAHLLFPIDTSGAAGRFDNQPGFGYIGWALEIRFLLEIGFLRKQWRPHLRAVGPTRKAAVGFGRLVGRTRDSCYDVAAPKDAMYKEEMADG